MKHKATTREKLKTSIPPVYRPAVVTFLDVLGFSSLVKSGTAIEVAKVLGTLRGFAEKKKSDEIDEIDEGNAISFSFSDCIVRIRFLDGVNEVHPTGHLFHEILDLVHIQGELVPHRILVRGGITMGSIYAVDSTVFGPAMVRAYELEAKSAIYPRIVIDPVLLTAVRDDHRLRSSHHSVKDEIQAIRNLIRRGENGAWFVDYLQASFQELDEPDDWPVFLSLHRDLVLQRYQDPSRAAFLDKILWLATYHNDVVSTIPERNFKLRGISRDDLILRTKDVPELARMPKRTSE